MSEPSADLRGATVAAARDSLLDRVRQWIIVRFALNTDQDLWGWLFVIGAAAHLEHLAVAILWVADRKPTPFEQYQPELDFVQF